MLGDPKLAYTAPKQLTDKEIAAKAQAKKAAAAAQLSKLKGDISAYAEVGQQRKEEFEKRFNNRPKSV